MRTTSATTCLWACWRLRSCATLRWVRNLGSSFILQIARALEGGGGGCAGQGVVFCLWRQCLLVKHTPGRVHGGKVWMRLQGVGSSCTVLCCTVLRLIVKFYNISYNLSVGLLSLTLMRNITVRGQACSTVMNSTVQYMTVRYRDRVPTPALVSKPRAYDVLIGA